MKKTQITIFELDNPHYSCIKHLNENFKCISEDIQMIVQKVTSTEPCNSGDVGCTNKVEYIFEELDT